MHGLILALLVSFAGDADLSLAVGKDNERQCALLKKKIERIHSQMRAGYSTRKGNQLAARLRELQKKRAKICR